MQEKKNQLYKNPNIAKLGSFYRLCSWAAFIPSASVCPRADDADTVGECKYFIAHLGASLSSLSSVSASSSLWLVARPPSTVVNLIPMEWIVMEL